MTETITFDVGTIGAGRTPVAPVASVCCGAGTFSLPGRTARCVRDSSTFRLRFDAMVGSSSLNMLERCRVDGYVSRATIIAPSSSMQTHFQLYSASITRWESPLTSDSKTPRPRSRRFHSSMVSVLRFYGFTSELACAPLAAAATQDNRGPASKGEFSIAFRLPLCGSSCCPETVALI